MPYKVTFFGQQQGDKLGGWQWSIYNNLGTLAGVQAQAAILAPLLDQILGNQGVIVSYRISLTGAFRQSQIFRTGFVAASGGTGNSSYIALDVQLILTAPYALGANYKTISWLRALPSGAYGVAGEYTGAVGTPTMNKFLAALYSGGWGVWCLSKARTPFPFKAGSFNPATGIITGIVGLGAATNNLKVRIQGCGVANPLNRIWICTYDGASVLTLNGWNPTLPFIPITGLNPTVNLQTYTFASLNPSTNVPPGAGLGIASVHKTGRPTGLLGGRRKTRRYAGAS